ncbi:molybdenum cofactor sulfurase [Cucurbita pepo subsp. pepo]|uniref:molybdenum cofactor sulfurase n=1 Tax=Cucurbita pepo subsp. pepo TaxID=3664 RepID=UPI000C9D284B|nr:molybdenum cofactor sulfurase [Cucurbita pepo subsp. pepo]
MQPPCLMEIAAACGGGSGGGSSCCPTPLLNFPSSTSTTSTTPRTSAASRRDFTAKATAGVFPNTNFTNPESLPAPPQALALFLAAFPQYNQTQKIDQIRNKQYYHLNFTNHTCLDYIGIGLFSYHQFQKHHNPFPSSNLNFPFFGVSYRTGNFKSRLLENGLDSDLESAIKRRIFRFLNVSDSDYSMVFTANRTSAFKLLAESYPFQTSNKLLTVYDYESEAVEAMVNTSQNRGALTMSAEFSWPRLRINSRKLKEMIVSKNKKKKTKKGLFVFPLHSRITGARYPYLWMSIAQENRWHVLVDACALGPKDMDCFGLSLFRPDFLVCSFYKVFGENPSGFGCLLVKKSVISILDTNSCSSNVGIVNLVPADKLFQLAEDSSGTDTELEIHHQQFMSQMVPSTSSFSGPISYESMKTAQTSTTQFPETEEDTNLRSNVSEIETKCKGLDQMDSLGLILISTRARCLINWLVSSLLKLKHPNTEGVSLVKIYGPKVKFDRGPALAFNVFDWKGEKVEPVLVQKLADRSNISLSYGFLQNIWFPEKYAEEKGRVLERKEVGKDEKMKKVKANLGISVVTAALGFLTNFDDVYKLWCFVAQFLDADFVEKERWRYTALNQRTVLEVL